MKHRRIEGILATGIYLFVLILLYSRRDSHDDNLRETIAWMAYTSAIYGAFFAFTQWISPASFRKKETETGIAFSLLLFFTLWFALALCIWVIEQGANYWQYFMHGQALGIALLVMVLLSAYEGIKRLFRLAKSNDKSLSSRIAVEILVILGSGALFFMLLLALNSPLAPLWLCAFPYAYLLYALNIYWLVPRYEHRFLVYILLSIIFSLIAFIPFGLLLLELMQLAGFVFFAVWACVSLAVIPLSNYLYRRQKSYLTQLMNLRTALGQSAADLQFLRSQINPHFLFNILNTLYGTALQEDAERTASGIQKLGDMMRFMLHENNQDRILLAREIEYLRNYIDLQRLRTATSPVITVEHDINDVLESTYIAPMLLIPFVENAFKHGISLRKMSWIKISLHQSDGKLYFDVHNSIHRKAESDPERQHSGIGLENVKQRLAVLYPGKHELIIRETTQEYFVHLTLTL